MPHVMTKEDEQAPTDPGSDLWRSKWAKWFFVATIVLVPTTLVLILADCAPLGRIQMDAEGLSPRKMNILDIVIYALWTLVPPTWFFLEYNLHFPANLKRDPLAMDDMKYTQDLGARFWSGLLVLFGLVLFLKYNIHVR